MLILLLLPVSQKSSEFLSLLCLDGMFSTLERLSVETDDPSGELPQNLGSVKAVNGRGETDGLGLNDVFSQISL